MDRDLAALVLALLALVDWANNNAGFLGLLIFIVTLLLGWLSGIFGALRRRAKLRVDLISGPTFCSTFPTGRAHEGLQTHHTAISLYLEIVNVGSADTTVAAIHVGYHPHMRALIWRVKRLWLRDQITALGDFRVTLGENVKVYPFLFQRNYLIPGPNDSTFVPVGGRAGGICYWEQPESWGGFFPVADSGGRVHLKVRVIDIYRRKFKRIFKIRMVSLEEARLYHPEFGTTHEAMRAGQHPAAPNPVPTRQPGAAAS